MTDGHGGDAPSARRVAELREPPGPVPLLLSFGYLAVRYVYAVRAGTLMELAWPGYWDGFLGSLFGGGSGYVFAAREPLGSWREVRHSVHTWSFVDGAITRVFETDRPGKSGILHPAGSPDGHRLAVVEVWDEPGAPPGLANVRITVWIRDGNGPWHEVMTLPGGTTFNPSGPPVQWSPDGTRLALNVTEPQPRDAVVRSVLVVDCGGDAAIRRYAGCGLHGSLSWSPDGSRLLVTDEAFTLSDLHLDTGLIAPTACLPTVLRTFLDEPRDPLGYAEDGNLLVARQGKAEHTISVIDPGTAEESVVLRLSGGEALFPILARGGDWAWSPDHATP